MLGRNSANEEGQRGQWRPQANTRGGKKEGQARMGTEAAGVGESGLPPRRGSLCKLCHTRVTRDSSMGIRSAISFKLILIHDIAAGLFFFFSI